MTIKKKALNDSANNQPTTSTEVSAGIDAGTISETTVAIAKEADSDNCTAIPMGDTAQVTVPRSLEDSLEERNSGPGLPGAINWTIGNLVMQLFQADPDQEFTINAVVAALMQNEPGLNDNAIRYTITELKRKSLIHHVRNEGHFQILKFTKPGEERPFPRPPLLDKPITKSALKASPAEVALDLAVLKEATAMLGRLQALVHRNREVLNHISKLRAVL